MYWLLIFELVGQSVHVNWIGSYETYEKCIYEMREAEIAIHKESQAMSCLYQDKGADRKPTPKSGTHNF